MIRLTKAEVEYYVNAKPRTRRIPGYFSDDGTLHRGPYFTAHLGSKTVGYAHGTYIAEAGVYAGRSCALEGAKLFQEHMKERLAAGDYIKEAAE